MITPHTFGARCSPPTAFRNVRAITTVVTEVLAANPETTPLDIETALRAAAAQAYLVANSTTAGFEIVLGMPVWRAALADAGRTVEQNWGCKQNCAA